MGQTDREEVDPPLDDAVLRELYDSVNDAIFVHDGQTGEIIDVNQSTCKLYGFTRTELRNRSIGELSSGTPPYTHEQAIDRVEKASQGDAQRFEWQARDADDNIFWIEVSMEGTEIDGQSYTFVIVRDISARKAYEQQIKEQRDNLELLNQVFRHDIRNDLTVVNGFAEMLEDEVTSEGRQMLITVRESVDEAIRLTETARDLSAVMLQSEFEKQRISLKETLDEQLERIQSEFQDAEVSIEGAIPHVTIKGDDMLSSVFRNLLQNAVQHNDKEIAEISVSVVESEETISVRIADNGPGVLDTQKETIFGKGEKGLQSAGTGIGLYLVKTLVEGYGGTVWVEDNEPEGAVFVVELQRIDQKRPNASTSV